MNPILQSIKKLASALCLVSLVSCSGAGGDTGPAGKVAFWTKYADNVLTPVKITVDNVEVGSLITTLATTPTCDQPGTFTKSLLVGEHSISAKNATKTWTKITFTINEGDCYTLELGCTGTSC